VAKVVAACATIHSPGLTGWIDEEEEPKRKSIFGGLDELKRRLHAAKPDVIIGIANDHMLTSPPYNMPDFAIGVAEQHSGPAPGVDDWLRLQPFTVPGSRPLARFLINEAMPLGVNFVCHEKVDFDDNFSVPLTYLTPEMNVPFIPVLVNCFVPPQPTPERCYEAGRVLKAIVEEKWPGSERVAVVAKTSGRIGDQALVNQFVQLLHLRDGRVVEVWNYNWDQRGLAEAFAAVAAIA